MDDWITIIALAVMAVSSALAVAVCLRLGRGQSLAQRTLGLLMPLVMAVVMLLPGAAGIRILLSAILVVVAIAATIGLPARPLAVLGAHRAVSAIVMVLLLNVAHSGTTEATPLLHNGHASLSFSLTAALAVAATTCWGFLARHEGGPAASSGAAAAAPRGPRLEMRAMSVSLVAMWVAHAAL